VAHRKHFLLLQPYYLHQQGQLPRRVNFPRERSSPAAATAP
jgi:hypothetical protein